MTGSERPQVLVHCDTPEDVLDLIESRFPQLPVATCRSYDELATVAAQTRPGIVLSYKFEPRRYPAEAIRDLDSVRWIHVGGAGCDHLMPWDPTALTVTNASGTQGRVMAEFTLCAAFGHNLRFPQYIRQQADRCWQPRMLRQTAGSTMAVLGTGRNGQAIAALAQAVGLTTLGVRTRPGSLPGFDEVHAVAHLQAILARADVVVVVLPLTEYTRNLVDAAALDAMKPGALLVNLARGGVVDESALAARLETGHVGGAVLDVFATEPLPPESPLWDLDNGVVTPHTAALFEGWKRAAAEVFCENLDRWLAGSPLTNVVDPEKGY